jgi:hypothetical protein
MHLDITRLAQPPRECNSNNHKEYKPYMLVENTLTIDPTWYNEVLIPYTKDNFALIAEKYSLTIQFEPISVPHEVGEHKAYGDLYAAVLEQYNYDKWLSSVRHLIPEVEEIPLTDNDLVELEKITKLVMITGRKVSTEEQEELSFIETLRKTLAKHPDGSFIKLANTSSKNEQPLKPLDTVTQVLSFLTRTKQFFYSYSDIVNQRYCFPRNQCLIIMPWNDTLNKDFEFRVFVHRRKLVAFSQQQWYDKKSYNDDFIDKAAHAIAALCEQVSECMPFGSAVLDVWVDTSYLAHLIECNPFGASQASGSSLFHWVNDYDILHGDGTTVYFRCYN